MCTMAHMSGGHPELIVPEAGVENESVRNSGMLQ